MARGNGRQKIVRDDADRDRLQEQLGKAAIRCSWRVFAFAIMSNHLHIVLKTPQPNLARGMQAFLSGYANAWARRHKFSGHVFQGRYRTELVEDETYLLGDPLETSRRPPRRVARWPKVRHQRLALVPIGLDSRPAGITTRGDDPPSWCVSFWSPRIMRFGHALRFPFVHAPPILVIKNSLAIWTGARPN